MAVPALMGSAALPLSQALWYVDSDRLTVERRASYYVPYVMECRGVRTVTMHLDCTAASFADAAAAPSLPAVIEEGDDKLHPYLTPTAHYAQLLYYSAFPSSAQNYGWSTESADAQIRDDGTVHLTVVIRGLSAWVIDVTTPSELSYDPATTTTTAH